MNNRGTRQNSLEITFDNQKLANETIFEDNRPDISAFKELFGQKIPDYLGHYLSTGKVYDVAGFNARHVVALMSNIVNSEHWKENRTFYLLINRRDGEEAIKIRRAATPPKDQPGKAYVSLHTRERYGFLKAKEYKELLRDLKQKRQGEPPMTERVFAKHMKNLFHNNENIHAVPSSVRRVIAEAYAILLFEIARRLVRPFQTNGQKEYDTLPIGCVIARSVDLLYNGACSFEDFFSGDLYCFEGEASEREDAINRINKRYHDTFPTVSVSKESCVAELIKMFGEDQGQNAAAAASASASASASADGKFKTSSELYKVPSLPRNDEQSSSSRYKSRGVAAEELNVHELLVLRKNMATSSALVSNSYMNLKEEPVTTRLMDLGFNEAYMVIGQFLLSRLNRADFCRWLTCSRTERNPERQEDCYNCLMRWWNNISPLNNRCNPRCTQVHRKFVTQRMGEKPVTELAGIGDKNGIRLSNAGLEKAYEVLGVFLVMKKDEQGFKRWLKDTCEARSNHQSDCFDCLKQWCDNFL